VTFGIGCDRMQGHYRMTMTKPRPGVPVSSDLLIGEWIDTPCSGDFERFRKAAAWGADQQLRLCVKWFDARGYAAATIEALKADMRPEPPKPPTLKEQALEAFDSIALQPCPIGRPSFDPNEPILIKQALIRRALETLP
jgi:hypothetical protein